MQGHPGDAQHARARFQDGQPGRGWPLSDGQEPQAYGRTGLHGLDADRDHRGGRSNGHRGLTAAALAAWLFRLLTVGSRGPRAPIVHFSLGVKPCRHAVAEWPSRDGRDGRVRGIGGIARWGSGRSRQVGSEHLIMPYTCSGQPTTWCLA
jgi:hypothetical protein